eukprot:CAMPEP_0194364642 /NCGR_PEP_ID=MMETSP0174-20130528/12506_1 /TAXON_ID=216777 /ORGANISM="Proboscia alata, Strain PI-D3" /LENGTH=271 /DNA_ID=CAMNT_0039138747 /DNA_START=124 /DNA_END=939 /DNA_ORIENTATION=-
MNSWLYSLLFVGGNISFSCAFTTTTCTNLLFQTPLTDHYKTGVSTSALHLSEEVSPLDIAGAPDPVAEDIAAAPAPVTDSGAVLNTEDAAPDAPPTRDPNLPPRQREYGTELPLPDTYLRCGRCQASYAITTANLMPRGRRVGCSLCRHTWFQMPDKIFSLRDGFELTTLPERDISRIRENLSQNRRPDFRGDHKVYVGNLDFYSTEDDLVEYFQAEAGPVGDCNLVRGDDGRSRGFAFLTFLTEEGGSKGLTLDGKEFQGRELQIRLPNN